MTDILAKLKACAFDKDNMPNMRSEKKLSVGDALDAAAEIEKWRRVTRDLLLRQGYANESLEPALRNLELSS
jgi:cytochrome c